MTDVSRPVLVAGGGGFIGGHLVRDLLNSGAEVRSVDCRPLDDWHQIDDRAENLVLDLSELAACRKAVEGIADLYNLASDMGGMGFIESNKALCMLSVLINTHLLVAARDADVDLYFFASSACVYAAEAQATAGVAPLSEELAYPAMPEDGYGWEKLFGERMCHHFNEDFELATRVARYHNVYGPLGTWDGGREKAPAAICRKVATAVLTGSNAIEVWGDGEQTRSFTYIDDCVRGTRLLMQSDFSDPVNIGSSQLVTVNDLVELVEDIAGTRLERRYVPEAPQGVRGRNSDNTLVRKVLDWEPSTSLEAGMRATYEWVYGQVAAKLA
jgi:GDP-L-fucose synthase